MNLSFIQAGDRRVKGTSRSAPSTSQWIHLL
jgi:hypothetical protein